jgi:hypothetical protein
MLMMDVRGLVGIDEQCKAVNDGDAACTVTASVGWRKIGWCGYLLDGGILEVWDEGWVGGGGNTSNGPLIETTVVMSAISMTIGRSDGVGR